GAELGRGPPYPPGHRPDPAMAASQQRNDPVRLAQLLRTQHHRVVAVELAAIPGHSAIVPTVAWTAGAHSPGRRTSGRSEPQPAQLLRVTLPVLGHAYVQVQIDPGAEQPLDLGPSPRADLLQAGSLAPDHDRLLAGPLHVHVGVDASEVLLPLDLLHQHRDRVRQ